MKELYSISEDLSKKNTIVRYVGIVNTLISVKEEWDRQNFLGFFP